MTHINKELLRCFLFHRLMLTGQLRDFASPSLSFQTPLLLLLPASPELLKYESPTPFCNSKHFKRRQLYSVLSHFLKAARVINTFGGGIIKASSSIFVIGYEVEEVFVAVEGNNLFFCCSPDCCNRPSQLPHVRVVCSLYVRQFLKVNMAQQSCVSRCLLVPSGLPGVDVRSDDFQVSDSLRCHLIKTKSVLLSIITRLSSCLYMCFA